MPVFQLKFQHSCLDGKKSDPVETNSFNLTIRRDMIYPTQLNVSIPAVKMIFKRNHLHRHIFVTLVLLVARHDDLEVVNQNETTLGYPLCHYDIVSWRKKHGR